MALFIELIYFYRKLQLFTNEQKYSNISGGRLMKQRKTKIYVFVGIGVFVILAIILGTGTYFLVKYASGNTGAFVDAWGVFAALLGVLIALGSTIIAIFGAIFALKQMQQNKEINEAELTIRINSEFINNRELVKVEHEFEKYFYQYNLLQGKENLQQEFDVKVEFGNKRKMKKKERKRLKKTKKIERVEDIKFGLDLDIDSHERQELVNYLVHLESVATLVNHDILRLEVISDLVAYRYFIAVNNPYVQNCELIPYRDYYRECYKIYKRWKKLMKDKNMVVPMEKNGKIFEDFSE